MRRPLMAFLFSLVLLAVTGCAGTSSGDDVEFQPSNEPVRVIVTNDGFYEATIYLLRGLERRRLGTVNGSSTATFTLQRHLVVGITDLRFAVDWIGRQGAQTTETFLAEPGEEIRLRIR